MKFSIFDLRFEIVLMLCVAGMAIFEPKEPLPDPIEAMPVLLKAKTWVMYNKPIAYYQMVRMPDNSVQQLKITPALNAKVTDPAPDAKTWQALADKQWAAMKLEELNKPKPCPTCGGTGFVQ
jgi:hypothetical protein